MESEPGIRAIEVSGIGSPDAGAGANISYSRWFITIFCGKERFWREPCVALDAPGLAEDPRLKTFDQRFLHREEVVSAIQERFLAGTTAHWITQLNGKVPCGPVSSLTEALKAPGLEASGTIVEVDHPQFGRVREVNTPIRFEGRREQYRRAPQLGEDTQAVLREYLAYSDERIAELRQAHVI